MTAVSTVFLVAFVAVAYAALADWPAAPRLDFQMAKIASPPGGAFFDMLSNHAFASNEDCLKTALATASNSAWVLDTISFKCARRKCGPNRRRPPTELLGYGLTGYHSLVDGVAP